MFPSSNINGFLISFSGRLDVVLLSAFTELFVGGSGGIPSNNKTYTMMSERKLLETNKIVYLLRV